MIDPPEDALTESISTFALGGVSPGAITSHVVTSIPQRITEATPTKSQISWGQAGV